MEKIRCPLNPFDELASDAAKRQSRFIGGGGHSPMRTGCNTEMRRNRLAFRCLRLEAGRPQNSDYGTKARATMGQALAIGQGVEG